MEKESDREKSSVEDTSGVKAAMKLRLWIQRMKSAFKCCIKPYPTDGYSDFVVTGMANLPQRRRNWSSLSSKADSNRSSRSGSVIKVPDHFQDPASRNGSLTDGTAQPSSIPDKIPVIPCTRKSSKSNERSSGPENMSRLRRSGSGLFWPPEKETGSDLLGEEENEDPDFCSIDFLDSKRQGKEGGRASFSLANRRTRSAADMMGPLKPPPGWYNKVKQRAKVDSKDSSGLL